MKAKPKQVKAAGPEDSKLLHTWFKVNFIERLDDFRYKNRFPTRKDAIQWLLEYALDQKPKVEG